MLIFGYGSLLSEIGINGRGLSKQYCESDLTVVQLNGYKREWNAVWGPIRFLGLIEEKNSYVNGIIFPLERKDVNTFLISEGSQPDDKVVVYDFVDVTEKVYPKQDHKVFTCVTSRPQKDVYIPPYYFKTIGECLNIRGKNFETEFWETTEDDPQVLDFKNQRLTVEGFLNGK